MRRKQLVRGLNNSQPIRFMINGMGMYGQVSDLENFATTSHRIALWDSLQVLANYNEHAKNTGGIPIVGHAGTWNGHQVQVDLIERV